MGFFPEDLGNLIAHWDYRTGVYKDTNNTPAAAGDSVRIWNSRYGSKSLPQTTLSLQPTVNSEQGYIVFSNQTLGGLNVFGNEFSGINGPLTYYIVSKQITASGTDVPIVRFGSSTTTSAYRFSFAGTTSGYFRISNGTGVTSSLTLPEGNSNNIISASFDNGTGKIYKGSSNQTIESWTSPSSIGTNTNNSNPNAFTIGGRLYSSSTSSLTTLLIQHLLVYKAIHTDSERLQVMNYLKENSSGVYF